MKILFLVVSLYFSQGGVFVSPILPLVKKEVLINQAFIVPEKKENFFRNGKKVLFNQKNLPFKKRVERLSGMKRTTRSLRAN